MGMRRGRGEGEVIKAYAKSVGVGVRAAQKHREKGDPRWLEWNRNRVAESVATGERTATEAGAIVVASLPETEGMSREVVMETAAYETWQAIEKLKREAINGRNTLDLPQLIKAEVEAQKSYRDASRARVKADVEEGRLFTSAQMEENRRLLRSVKAVMDGMPGQLGPRANPLDHDFGRRACEDWLRSRFAGQLEHAQKELAA